KGLGGEMEGKVLGESEEELRGCEKMGVDVGKVLRMEEVVKGEEGIFGGSGVREGEVLKGVELKGCVGRRHSVVMRGK
ncbi:fructose-bisphosphatase class II, partial [Bacillus pumilus]|uniref:fructose-bisphosphatase class II n=1 Tax=Bacillus pumilus TaxID=1408 RepID=UPI0011AAF2F7